MHYPEECEARLISLQTTMNARPTLMIVIHQRLAPIQSVLFIVHATRDTPATADPVSVSYKYMNDTIKAETGKTAVDQINLYLIEEAKNLLLAPNASISGTAYKLGFEYPQYFSRLFKKKTGVSPREYIEKAPLN